MRRLTWVMAMMLVCGAGAAETGATLHARLSPPVIPFHQAATLTITLETPAEANIAPPEFPGEIEGLEIAPGEVTTDTVEGERRVVTRKYLLSPVKAGEYVLPSLETAVPEGAALRTPALLLQARELTEAELAAVQEFEDIVLPTDVVAATRETPWGWIAATAAVIAVAGAIAALVLWCRSAPEWVAPPPTAWESALRRLRELREKKLPELGKQHQFFVDLSSILRFYIEDRFHVHAPEQTTPEFLESAAKSGQFSDEHQLLLANFLRLADRVKFAQFEPSYEECQESFAAVKQFVDETVPRVEAVQGQEAAA